MSKQMWKLNKTPHTTERNNNRWSFKKAVKGNQNPYIEDEPTTQWPKEKLLKDKQRNAFSAIINRGLRLMESSS
jgi:hypothetical protein